MPYSKRISLPHGCWLDERTGQVMRPQGGVDVPYSMFDLAPSEARDGVLGSYDVTVAFTPDDEVA